MLRAELRCDRKRILSRWPCTTLSMTPENLASGFQRRGATRATRRCVRFLSEAAVDACQPFSGVGNRW